MTKMNCELAREEMLIADLEELRGEGNSELAMHLRSCADCRAHVERILHAHTAMGTGIAAFTPQSKVVPLRRRHTAWRWAPIPLAAAAVLALLLVQQQQEGLPKMDAVVQMMFREAPLVAPPAGKQAMVIEKNNMTIVWLYDEETT
jgi:predicted anti-sigma-YlaC factor YlaD